MIIFCKSGMVRDMGLISIKEGMKKLESSGDLLRAKEVLQGKNDQIRYSLKL